MEEKLFDILVFNRSEDKFRSYWKEKVMRYRKKESDEEWEKQYPKLINCFGKPTRWMNSVIGYISIYKNDMDIFTTLSIDIRNKKFLEGKPDIYYDNCTFTRFRTNKNMDSKTILDGFNKDLIDITKKELKGRYIDLEAWRNFSKYINWYDVFYSHEEKKEFQV